MKILVTFAVQSEMGSWRGPRDFRGDLRIVRTGIGMRRPQDELRKQLASPVDVCITSGLAGSLKEQHAVGTVVVARGVKSEGKNTIVPCDGGLVDAAVRCGAKPVNFFFTSAGIADSNAERVTLAGIADTVDMESFHVLGEARRGGIPSVAIRAISDSPARKLPIDFGRLVTVQGELAWPRMIGELLKDPRRVPAFIRFGLDSSAAIRNLTTFFDRYLKFLMMNESSFRFAPEHMSR